MRRPVGRASDPPLSPHRRDACATKASQLFTTALALRPSFQPGQPQGGAAGESSCRPGEGLTRNEVTQKGAVGASGLAHKASRENIISLILLYVKLFDQKNMTEF